MLKGIFGMSLRPYRNYKVLKRMQSVPADGHGLRPYRNYKVLKPPFPWFTIIIV